MQDDLAQRCVGLIGALGLGAAGDVERVVPLTGGVASDIARVDLAGKSICVKFALARLRVAADWHAPVHRSGAEYAWLTVAGRVAPGMVPHLYGHSPAHQGFAMEYIAGPHVRLWKASLMAGHLRKGEAAAVADALGRVHAAGSAPTFDRSAFRNGADFHALRVEPYLRFTATRHPDLAPRLLALADGLDRSAVTLVHGDVSPKNILFRGDQPILLDAECASMGDPAFDVAFCLNHLLLKSLHLPVLRAGVRAAVVSFCAAYLPHVVWEDADATEARVAALLPALMLARIDGKSPVEYLDAGARDHVRALARPLILDPAATLAEVLVRLGETGGRP